jgi:hypothetical protein
MLLLPLLLVGCSKETGSEWNPTGIEADGKVTSGEAARKAKVQALVVKMADESPGIRNAAYTELRDTFVRKRDIPWLTEEIARNTNRVVTSALWELFFFLKGERWRLPDKRWTTDEYECIRSYGKELENLGCFDGVGSESECRPQTIFSLAVLEDAPIGEEKKNRIIDLILTLEPEKLEFLSGDWTDIGFLTPLSNLEELALKNIPVSDLGSLKGMPGLRVLRLSNTGQVQDFTPLKELPNLEWLALDNTKVADLTPLKELRYLSGLYLENTQVSDLSPLEGIGTLARLDLRNTKVTDVTALKGMRGLRELDLRNTKVVDLTPLKGLPGLAGFQLPETPGQETTEQQEQ